MYKGLIKMKKISIIVPIYNEEKVIPIFYQKIGGLIKKYKQFKFEVIFVDDGSLDTSLSQLIKLAKYNKQIKIIEFSRNFGKESAMTAGLEMATGDAVIPIDADLQDPVELIPKMINAWERGAEVVLARRTDRSSDSFLKRTTSNLFYKIHNTISPVKIPNDVGDFRLMDKVVVDGIKCLPEKQRFMKGLFAWVGFKTTTLDYTREKRIAGSTKFSGWKLWNFALEGITSFSSAPLRIWTYIGSFGALISFVYGLITIIKTLVIGNDVPGYTSLIVSIIFFGSIQLIGIGMLGEYIGRVYMETKNRPIYIVRKKYGF